MNKLVLTSAQTVGPFFAPALLREDCRRNVLTGPQTMGERIRIEGIVRDGDNLPVPDALIEIWQANAHGRYNHPADQGSAQLDPSFSGFGRSGTAEDGSYWFETVKPGPVPFDGSRLQAPHICVTVFARGLLNHLVTRLYFEDEEVANSRDPVLLCLPEQRRPTLLARCDMDGGVVRYRFDIILQGANETAFFNV
ncbi:protocatechuate 3,4-dioxygenase subunit alpha [Dictyobacter aurantiacus]|uniref:Protocatechuate 3,4-dioxygenase subunit alpha n=1 Tax=Dictyobacter aurantiacus TaxID=1936993 RepID=A0A401Z8C2_9CHLR|nr:protocatechuate 3,4-dioxygenase subunit alpha [Dictyobacter aurantiacus]GCE03111.1 protocatechuate 3,4-dioxygenase subunit alpha [Dictyobacter aurantiacus]